MMAKRGSTTEDCSGPAGPVGYFGVPMGTRFGVPLIAAEPRIAVAVLGLFGVPAADTESAFARAARQVTVPVLFLRTQVRRRRLRPFRRPCGGPRT
jgi:hypothetical protein